jgi:ADP-dependent phosphofructokinase/glucokinase
MDANRLKQIYKLHGADRLIENILRNNDVIEGLQKRLEGLQYLGRFNLNGRDYSFYVRQE